jgi:hypothetical protein
MQLEPNTVLILLGLFINGAVVIGYFTKLERRFTKIEMFLHVKHGFNGSDD